MAESCDVYFYNLVLSQGLTSDSLAAYSRMFGLGSSTELGLTGERAGFVPDPRWKQDTQQEAWYTGDTLNMVIGQGFLTVTPLQMAVVTAAVANGGYLVKPQLLSRIDWPDWLGYGTQTLEQTQGRKLEVDPLILAKVRQGMREAVESDHGTAKVMRGLGVSVAGKTGSAQHYPLDRPTHAWFVCFAPAEAPRYACCVFVSEGGHGGSVAAPVARKILAAAFGVSAGSGGPAGPSD
jgi:penicillin-binding protein 2